MISLIFICLEGWPFVLSCCLIAMLFLVGFKPPFSRIICCFDLRKKSQFVVTERQMMVYLILVQWNSTLLLSLYFWIVFQGNRLK